LGSEWDLKFEIHQDLKGDRGRWNRERWQDVPIYSHLRSLPAVQAAKLREGVAVEFDRRDRFIHTFEAFPRGRQRS
jgi:hypothetical protein